MRYTPRHLRRRQRSSGWTSATQTSDHAGRTAITAALIGFAGPIVGALIAGAIALWSARDTTPALRVVGNCTIEGQILVGEARQLDRRAGYLVEVRDPSGKPYRGGSMIRGTVTPEGHVDWVWRCSARDRPGLYRTRVANPHTGYHSAWATFGVRITERGSSPVPRTHRYLVEFDRLGLATRPASIQ
jgi:hypothetical protein